MDPKIESARARLSPEQKRYFDSLTPEQQKRWVINPFVTHIIQSVINNIVGGRPVQTNIKSTPQKVDQPISTVDEDEDDGSDVEISGDVMDIFGVDDGW